jgi:uncharacterized protein YbjQ (UPF0145 family)
MIPNRRCFPIDLFSVEDTILNNDPIARRTPYQVSAPKYSVAHHMVTTAFEVPGFKIVRTLGIVRGIVVRSRNVITNIGAALQTIIGGNITAWSNLCEQTRSEAFDIMILHATEIGANAIIGARYDATELSSGVTEVLAYGTAVIVDPAQGSDSYLS